MVEGVRVEGFRVSGFRVFGFQGFGFYGLGFGVRVLKRLQGFDRVEGFWFLIRGSRFVVIRVMRLGLVQGLSFPEV